MDVGVIGTAGGAEKYRSWVANIRKPILPPEKGKPENKMLWPGFQAVFNVEWPEKPFAFVEIDEAELSRRIRSENRHEGISRAVELFDTAVRKYLRQEDARPPLLWFVVVPEEVFLYGRPKSRVPKLLQEKSTLALGKRGAQSILSKGSLFIEEMEAAALYEYELNFHNQLKAKLLDTGQVLQVVRETTLCPDAEGESTRRSLQDPASVAWNLSTTSFYKTGARPWRVADIRDGVCYVGLVFKKIENARGTDNACCGAQMFLSTGEGVVFRGAVGPWYSQTEKTYHLSREKAAELMHMVVESYREIHGYAPKELFIHGKIEFSDSEWDGFRSAAPAETVVVGIRIRRQSEVKLYRYGQNPVLRGTAIIASERKAYLWTVGYTPRLATYPGREVPNPLTIDVVRPSGLVSMETILNDLMALTKLNYNNSGFSDGSPVTLRFADLVGEILTAGPVSATAPLPFKYYI
ncbi:hypothetical protein EYW49_22110 [Siculibacillus lacustris]|uniref:Piwi domain-containing protein n=2 Tax=Siculibacillus lacustris TaxID=1549641 RepID=A0A4Q9VE29_9HYPH|nr:hypothetical protein EYW49_22110 [Siculibacillus lacustris]